MATVMSYYQCTPHHPLLKEVMEEVDENPPRMKNMNVWVPSSDSVLHESRHQTEIYRVKHTTLIAILFFDPPSLLL